MDVVVQYLESVRRVADLCTSHYGAPTNRDQLRFFQGEIKAVGVRWQCRLMLPRLVSHTELRTALLDRVQADRGRAAPTSTEI